MTSCSTRMLAMTVACALGTSCLGVQARAGQPTSTQHPTRLQQANSHRTDSASRPESEQKQKVALKGVTVTATRRKQKLQHVAMTVTSIEPEEIRDAQIDQIMIFGSLRQTSSSNGPVALRPLQKSTCEA